MLHSVWASPLSLPECWLLGRSCEAFAVYVTRRKSDIMLAPATGRHTVSGNYTVISVLQSRDRISCIPNTEAAVGKATKQRGLKLCLDRSNH